jgi:hypothetical protein
METQTENQIEWGKQRKGKKTRQKRDIGTEERIEGEKSSEHTTSKQSGLWKAPNLEPSSHWKNPFKHSKMLRLQTEFFHCQVILRFINRSFKV